MLKLVLCFKAILSIEMKRNAQKIFSIIIFTYNGESEYFSINSIFMKIYAIFWTHFQKALKHWK